MTLGAQFFTLKDFCKTPDGISESLAKVADIGYTTVQISGTCEFEPEWMASELKKNGLKCVLTHTKPDKILADTVGVCNDHKTFGCNNIGIGMMPQADFSVENYNKFVEDFLPIAKTIKENGCKLYYHNHYQEFWKREDGKNIFEHMLEDFPVDLLNITLDTYWVQYAGGDPAQWIKKLSGRLECIHLKDLDMVEKEHRMAPVGYGNINFDSVLRAAEPAGVEYLLVEQDKCYGVDPFECLKKSYNYLTSLGLK